MKRYRREITKLLGAVGAGTLAVTLLEKTFAQTVPQPERFISSFPEYTADVVVYRDCDYAVAVDKRGTTVVKSTNHAETIQKAIDYVQNQGGGKIYIAAGEYIISNTITVKGNNVLEGAGYNTVLKAGTDGMKILMNISKASNVIVRNLRLDGDYKAYQLLTITTKDGVEAKDILVENIWLHSNKRGLNDAIVVAWDIDQEYNLKRLRLRNIVAWDLDTGVDHDNVVFSFVEDIVVENSYFEIERVLNFFYTKHAVAKKVHVKASEYATFVVDSGSDDTTLEDCVSEGQPARLFGSNTRIRGGYYLNNIFFGDKDADWYGKDIVIEGAYIYGGAPIIIYGERAVVRNCRIRTVFDHAVQVQWRSDIPRRPRYVLLDGNEIDNAGRSVYCVLVVNAEKIVLKNNHLKGDGWGIFLDNDPLVHLVDNVFDVGSKPIALGDSWSGMLKARRNKGYATENSGVVTVVGDGSTNVFEVDVDHGLVSDRAVCWASTTRPTSATPSDIYVYLVDKDSDGFRETARIVVRFDTAPANGEVVEIYWRCEVVG